MEDFESCATKIKMYQLVILDFYETPLIESSIKREARVGLAFHGFNDSRWELSDY